MSGAVLGIWWVWVALAFILGIVEVFAPAYIFLGFALGALATALFVAVASGPAAAVVIAVFAVASLLAWVCLRVVFKKQSSGASIVTRDIND